jgi:hypothetical protein
MKLVTTLMRNNPRSSYAVCMLIRYVKRIIEDGDCEPKYVALRRGWARGTHCVSLH